jgi:hypothetical protein
VIDRPSSFFDTAVRLYVLAQDAAVAAADASLPPELIFVHGGHTEKIHDLAWHPTDEYTMASVADNGLVQVWKPRPDALFAE